MKAAAAVLLGLWLAGSGAEALAGTPAVHPVQQAAPMSPEEVRSLYAEAGELNKAGRYPAAEQVLRRLVAGLEAATGADSIPVAGALRAWSQQCANIARFAEAERALLRAQRIIERYRGTKHPELAYTQLELANIYLSLGRADEAMPLADSAETILKRSYGARHPAVGTALAGKARVAQQRGQFRESEALWNDSLGIIQGAKVANAPDVATVMHGLAATYLHQRDMTSALELIGRVLASVERNLGQGDIAYGLVLQSMAEIQIEEGLFADARATLETAMANQRKSLAPDHPILGRTYGNLAEVLALLGEKDKIDPLLEEADRLVIQAHTDQHPEYLMMLGHRIAAYRQLDRVGEVEVLVERAETLRKRLRNAGSST